MQVHNAPTRNVRKASSQPNPSAPNRGEGAHTGWRLCGRPTGRKRVHTGERRIGEVAPCARRVERQYHRVP